MLTIDGKVINVQSISRVQNRQSKTTVQDLVNDT